MRTSSRAASRASMKSVSDSYVIQAPLPLPPMQGGDAEGQRSPLNVAESGALHSAHELFPVGEVGDRFREVAVRRLVSAHDPADERQDPPEVEMVQRAYE